MSDVNPATKFPKSEWHGVVEVAPLPYPATAIMDFCPSFMSCESVETEVLHTLIVCAVEEPKPPLSSLIVWQGLGLVNCGPNCLANQGGEEEEMTETGFCLE